MKTLKQFLIIGLLFLSTNSQAQTFFEDSTTTYTHRHYGRVGEENERYNIEFYKETIFFDSSNKTEEFYTVKKNVGNGWGKNDSVYNLRVEDNKVYISNHSYKNKNNKKDTFHNELIYDFNLKQGDTFTNKNIEYMQDITYIVDTILNILYEDGKYHKTTIFHTKYGDSYRKKFIIKGYGTSSGFARIPVDNMIHWHNFKTFIICNKGNLIYKDTNFITKNKDTLKKYPNICTYKDLIKVITFPDYSYNINEVQKNKLLLYPNPANTYLHIQNIKKGNYIIYNMMGKEIQKGKLKDRISIKKLQSGAYFIIVENKNVTLTNKFMKE